MRLSYLLAPVALVAASSAFAQGAMSPGMSSGMAAAMSPAQYVAAAGASDLYERNSSELVLQSTRDPKIREFANMMIQQHTKSTADVTAAARQARVRVAPPKLMPDQMRMMRDLRAATGTARDSAYVMQQKTAHDMALNLHQTYSTQGTSEPLKTVAASIVPVVQQHIQMLQGMDSMGARAPAM